MADMLQKIIEHKRGEVAEAKRLRPVEQLRERLSEAPPIRDFAAALEHSPLTTHHSPLRRIRLIAEVKKASPSAGLIRENFDPVAIARTYERHGAACVSVLTDERFFQGHLDYLTDVRRAVSIPVLRKDFIIDRYQVIEARAAGADCILLIAECLDDCTLRDLYFYASELGMESLVEIYEPENLDRVVKLGARLIGINNRNLREMKTDLSHTLNLRHRVPPGAVLVSESGIHMRADVDRLEQAGVQAILVGETLMRSTDIGRKVDELIQS